MIQTEEQRKRRRTRFLGTNEVDLSDDEYPLSGWMEEERCQRIREKVYAFLVIYPDGSEERRTHSSTNERKIRT
jgi:hypothetical protein